MIEQKQQKRNAVASKSVQSFNEFTRSKNSKSSVKVLLLSSASAVRLRVDQKYNIEITVNDKEQ